jgi:hypothetical protein
MRGMRTIAVTVAALAGATAAFARPATSPDVTVLIGRATKALHSQATFKKAILLEADGLPAKKNAKVTSAAGITKWRFVYDNQATPHSKFASVVIYAANGKLGKPTGVGQPFTEDRRIASIPKLTLAKAVAKLRAAGYKRGFANVTLVWMLAPGNTEPLYVFGFGLNAKPQNVGVGTKTGKVKPL